MAIPLFKDDYETPIIFHTKTSGKLIPLINAEVRFEFTDKEGRRAGGGPCEIVSMEQGMAKYTFKPGELSQTGQYSGKVVVDLSQGAHRDSLPLDFEVVNRP